MAEEQQHIRGTITVNGQVQHVDITAGDLVMFRNKLMEVVGWTDEPVVYMRFVKEDDKPICPKCGEPVEERSTDCVIGCLNFQEWFRPVPTPTKVIPK